MKQANMEMFFSALAPCVLPFFPAEMSFIFNNQVHFIKTVSSCDGVVFFVLLLLFSFSFSSLQLKSPDQIYECIHSTLAFNFCFGVLVGFF